MLAVLDLFNDGEPELRVGDVANRLGVSESTASRLLALLEARSYVERDARTGMYALGLQPLTLAGVAMNHSELRSAALEEMWRLVSALGLGVVNLAVLHRSAVFYLGNVDGRLSPRYYTLIGRQYPTHATALGKVLLAWRDWWMWNRFWRNTLGTRLCIRAGARERWSRHLMASCDATPRPRWARCLRSTRV